jgi:hypothetical protein
MPPTTTPLVAGLLAFMLTAPLGCKDGDDGPPPDTGGETADEVGEDPPQPKVCKSSCDQCVDLQKAAFACMAFDNSFGDAELNEPLATFECIVCDNDGAWSAASTCETQAKVQGVYFTDMEAQAVPCDEPEPKPDPNPRPVRCDDWQPGDRVHLAAADTWNVDREFVHELIADPSLLIGCDDARMWRNNGSYRVALANSDDLLVHLGFANGDVIRNVNGYTISDPADAALAFFKLWTNTSALTVSVLRPGVGVLTFTYNLV